MKFLRSFVLLSAFFAVMHYAQAARLVPGDKRECTFQLIGMIASGDLGRIRSAGINYGDILCLHSEGGGFVEAIEIAEFLAGRGVTTKVGKNRKCMSACAIIFMAGSHWEEGIYFPRREMHVTATIGFHAPYVLPPDDTFTAAAFSAAYWIGLQSVARMMKLAASNDGEGAIPNRVLLELLSKSPNEFYYVDDVLKANELQIELKGLEPINWNALTACNACVIKNEGRARVDACHRPVSTRNLSNSIVEFTYSGFAGEGAYDCVVRIQESDGQSKAAIAPTVAPNDYPLQNWNFSILDISFGVNPKKKIGNHVR